MRVQLAGIPSNYAYEVIEESPSFYIVKDTVLMSTGRAILEKDRYVPVPAWTDVTAYVVPSATPHLYDLRYVGRPGDMIGTPDQNCVIGADVGYRLRLVDAVVVKSGDLFGAKKSVTTQKVLLLERQA